MTHQPPPEKTALDLAIDDVLAELKVLTADTNDYARANDQLVKLHKLKMDEIKTETDRSVALQEVEIKSRPDRVSADTWVVAGANLAGILAIVWHEKAHIITTKAIQFAGKLR